MRTTLHRVVGAIVLAAGLSLSSAGLGQVSELNDQPDRQGVAEQADEASGQTQAESPSGSKPEPPRTPDEYEATCQQPKNGDQADLCQQWRMAEGTDTLARWALPQFAATSTGILFQAAATFFAAWAAIAASRAVKAAVRGVEIAERTLTENIRPFLSITETREVDLLQPNEVGSMKLGFRNHGNAPAVVEGGFTEFRLINVGDVPPLPTQLEPMKRRALSRGYFVLAAGGKAVWSDVSTGFSFSAEEIRQLRTRQKALYLLGFARYRSPLGTLREAGFCLHFDPPGEGSRGTGSFGVLPDHERNYDRNIDAEKDSHLPEHVQRV